MIGPKIKPDIKPGDYHLIVNDITERCKLYDSRGEVVWEDNCLARGQGSDYDWKHARTDTPPGLYVCGATYRDHHARGDHCGYDRTLMSYGWATTDLIDLENQETGIGRAGICLHGGGSGCGWPGAWERKQHLLPTFGCVRVYNHRAEEIADLVEQCKKTGNKVYVSVYQEG